MTAVGVLVDVGHSLREGFYMLWDTLWALIGGFAVAGAVQAFVSRQAMVRHLGDHRPASVARASLYGMVSSSCSYAASALARALFARGADFLSAMVFMFAATNLVLELGLVLAVLMGWPFVAAEFIGGAIMIVLLATVGAWWLRDRAVADARKRTVAADHHDHHGSYPGPGTGRARTLAGWSDAAAYTIGDLTMLRRELFAGFAAAGFLTVLVPGHVWADFFVRGHGFWTTWENALVGPLVAVISCVCSIGNVPLAAALWHGGSSFGGVVSFLFADLIALPLLLIYRKQYGARMAVRMLATFWLVMSLAGLVTEYLFRALGWVPAHPRRQVVGDTLHWNVTTGLDLASLVLLVAIYWLYRNQHRWGAGAISAQDPVCGMQVERAHAPAATLYLGRRVYFCSEHCRDRFTSDPDRYLLSPERV